MKVMLVGTVNSVSVVSILLLASQRTQSTYTDVKCDPDIPSRPRPESNGQPLALQQGNDLPTECPDGEYMDWYKCSPCEDGTFRTKQMAAENKYSKCLKCQTPKLTEIIEQPCNATRDTLISCEDEYFRYQVPGKPCNSSCKVCSICGLTENMFRSHLGRECSKHSNTVCCLHDDMFVIDGKCVSKIPITSPSLNNTSAITTATLASILTTSHTETIKNRPLYEALINQTAFPLPVNNGALILVPTHVLNLFILLFLLVVNIL